MGGTESRVALEVGLVANVALVAFFVEIVVELRHVVEQGHLRLILAHIAPLCVAVSQFD
jgi:hypothetical protein